MKDKVILTDCDGVLLDWEYGFATYMKDRFGLTPIRNDVYSVGDTYGITKEKGREYVRIYNESAAIGSLTPFRDAKKYVTKIHEELGYVFHCITSLSTDRHAGELRRKNLEAVFGKGVFEKVVCLECGADKDEALEEYRDTGCLWIEDKYLNCEAGEKVGLDPILIHHSHNKDMKTPYKTVMNWREIYESLI